MCVVMVGGIKNRIVCGQQWSLVSPVQVHAVAIEQSGKYGEQQVHVDGCEVRQDHHGHRPNKLVQVFVRNDCKRAGIVEFVMMSVHAPKETEAMADPVVDVLVQVRKEKDEDCLDPQWEW